MSPPVVREIVEMGDAAGLRPEADLPQVRERRVFRIEKLTTVKGHGEEASSKLHGQLAPLPRGPGPSTAPSVHRRVHPTLKGLW